MTIVVPDDLTPVLTGTAAEAQLRALVLTPHNAGVTPEVIAEGLRTAVANVDRYVAAR